MTIELSFDEDENDIADQINAGGLSDLGGMQAGAVRVYADAPYAIFVEYGTGPSKYKFSEKLYRALEQWCLYKLGMNGKKAKSFAYYLTQRILRNGLEPQPFLRVAIYRVLDEIERNVVSYDTLDDIGNAVVEEARRILRDTCTDYTMQLSNSLKYEVYDDPNASTDPPLDVDPDIEQSLRYKGGRIY